MYFSTFSHQVDHPVPVPSRVSKGTALLETGNVMVALSRVVFICVDCSDLSCMMWILSPLSLSDLSSLGSSLMMMGEQQTQRPDTALVRACKFGNL